MPFGCGGGGGTLLGYEASGVGLVAWLGPCGFHTAAGTAHVWVVLVGLVGLGAGAGGVLRTS